MTAAAVRLVAYTLIGLFCLIACVDHLDHDHGGPDHCTVCHIAAFPGLPAATAAPFAPQSLTLGMITTPSIAGDSFGATLQLACRAPPAIFLLPA